MANASPTIPPFALPNKRFVKQTLQQYSKSYLGSHLSYRRTVQQRTRPIWYEQKDEAMDPRYDPLPALAHSTLWRWLSCCGALPEIVRHACQLIRQKDPDATLHREAWAISRCKYRSEHRQRTLQQAMQCLVVDELFRRLFRKEMFPHFATAHGWK